MREQVVLISESNVNITMNDVSSVRTGLITETQTTTTTTQHLLQPQHLQHHLVQLIKMTEYLTDEKIIK